MAFRNMSNMYRIQIDRKISTELFPNEMYRLRTLCFISLLYEKHVVIIITTTTTTKHAICNWKHHTIDWRSTNIQTRFFPYSKASTATSAVCPARMAIALQLFDINDAVL